eukprot:5116910-Heterocapsa_arctica.AAC.1
MRAAVAASVQVGVISPAKFPCSPPVAVKALCRIQACMVMRRSSSTPAPMGAWAAGNVSEGGCSGGCRLACGCTLGQSLALHPPPTACSTRMARLGAAPT